MQTSSAGVAVFVPLAVGVVAAPLLGVDPGSPDSEPDPGPDPGPEVSDGEPPVDSGSPDSPGAPEGDTGSEASGSYVPEGVLLGSPECFGSYDPLGTGICDMGEDAVDGTGATDLGLAFGARDLEDDGVGEAETGLGVGVRVLEGAGVFDFDGDGFGVDVLEAEGLTDGLLVGVIEGVGVLVAVREGVGEEDGEGSGCVSFTMGTFAAIATSRETHIRVLNSVRMQA